MFDNHHLRIISNPLIQLHRVIFGTTSRLLEVTCVLQVYLELNFIVEVDLSDFFHFFFNYLSYAQDNFLS